MKKWESEPERDELHRAIWSIAEQLRGTVDGWDFKNYVLGTMFYRYLSENLECFLADTVPGGRYRTLSDEEAQAFRQTAIARKGFFIAPSGLFCNVCRSAGENDRLPDTLTAVFFGIEHSASGGSLAGLFDDLDLSSRKLGNTPEQRSNRLRALLRGVAEMRLGSVREQGSDLFGDAYEYLMTMYAGNAGKSGGEFFTPPEVSELLTRLGTVGKSEIDSVYDPACGSGSLLLQAVKVLGADGVRRGFFGQELNATTYNLCRINLILHDIGLDRFHIVCDDTLLHPGHRSRTPFELIVSNPPYSVKWPGDSDPALAADPRFTPAGALAPRSKADLAFVMHCLHDLAENGTAAIVCFPGVLYRGGSEKAIRRYLVDGNFLDSVIALPPNLFFGTTVATCILVLRKNRENRNIQFIDASGEFVRMPNHNRLTDENIRKIVEIYAVRQELPHFSHVAAYDEVAGQDYQLSVSAYVAAEHPEEKTDFDALQKSLNETVAREEVLRSRISEIMEEVNQADWNC